MSNTFSNVNTELELEFDHLEEAVMVQVAAEVCQSRWADLPNEDWCEEIDVTMPDGTSVPQGTVDAHGNDVWATAEEVALERAHDGF